MFFCRFAAATASQFPVIDGGLRYSGSGNFKASAKKQKQE